ncbi:hypothetical protein CR513_61090, partial [Mucuna pruriens]
MYFFDWFSNYSENNNVKSPFKIEKKLNPLEKISTSWRTLNNKIIDYEYPLLEGIKIPKIKTTPFQNVNAEDKVVDKKEIKKLHQQLNYSNIILETMLRKLSKIGNTTKIDIQSCSKLNIINLLYNQYIN